MPQWSYQEYGKHATINIMEWNFPIYLSLPLTIVCCTQVFENWGGIYPNPTNNKVMITYDLPALTPSGISFLYPLIIGI